MKRLFSFILCISLLVPVVFAQSTPKRVLTQAKIDKFLSDLPKLSKELERFADKYDQAFGMDSPEMAESFSQFTVPDVAAMFKAIQADAEVKKILAKYGWNDFWEVYGAVLSGYFLITFEDLAAQMNSPEFTKSIEQSKANYNKDDYQLVKKNEAKIQEIFESLE
jgi:O-methyltransferase involved in polyketide biosynthesis